MPYVKPISTKILENKDLLQTWLISLETRIATYSPSTTIYKTSIRENASGSLFIPSVSTVIHGVEREYIFDADFFGSPDYQKLTSLGDKLKPLSSAPSTTTIRRGEKSQSVDNFEEALEWLQGEALRGQTRQRYKGLGEMNPDQLWETTMDPSSRSMLRVTIEDAHAADQAFHTLMGDNVEPRRDFIEENALAVANLDI